MIPVRVQLRNFLCYDGEGEGVEFDFDGSQLWSISGDNGAGKSAIFDAITYTLFGQHRGGAQEDGRLIRSGSRDCEVTFEFRLDGRLYRVRRTVGRPRGASNQEPKTWQAAWFDPDIGDWRPIKETDRERGLTSWVQETLGFGFKTFVASVLLMQGQSDKLIQASPKERFEILSGILDLEPYKRLESAAIERRRTAREQEHTLQRQLQGLSPVAAEELQDANAALQESEQSLERALAEAASAEVALNEAHRYAQLSAELWAAQAALAETERLLQDAERIRAEYDEWRRISDALPRLRAALSDLEKVVVHAAQAEEARTRAASIDLLVLKRAATEAEKKEKEAEKRCGELRRECEGLNAALPPLQEILHRRRDLAEREEAVAKHGSPEKWEQRTALLEATLGEQQEEKRKADDRRQEAVQAGADARAALEHAEAQLSARRDAKNEAVCSRCGQKVDAKHIRAELEAAAHVAEAARERMPASTARFRQAEREAADAAARLDAAREQLQQAHEALSASRKAEDERQRASARLDNALDAVADAPTELRRTVVGATLAEVEQTFALLSQEMKEISAQVRSAEEAEHQARLRFRQAQQAYQQSLHERQALEAQAQRSGDAAEALQARAEVHLTDVDPNWRERALARDEAFVETLSARALALTAAEERYTALEEAAAQRVELEMKAKELRRGLENIRPEHRLPVEDADRRRQAAEDERRASQRRRDQASEELGRLKELQQRRRQLEADSAAATRSHALYARLGELLGRRGLQGFLMNEAIQGISQLANETLHRISSGQLRLDIERHTTIKGEEEIKIRSTDLASSDEPLDVQFISGSQKFRTSVALAAGIGQYAGRGAGSVRSLIIDEGFGSLDQRGREEIIDELRNLSQLMDRIIVVSHQDDFKDRTLFPTGYVLRKAGQRTQVERFV